MSSSLKLAGQVKFPAVISVNDFKFKSLSNWSYNISFGCRHGCSFCYVPSVATIKAENYLQKHVSIPKSWIAESTPAHPRKINPQREDSHPLPVGTTGFSIVQGIWEASGFLDEPADP